MITQPRKERLLTSFLSCYCLVSVGAFITPKSCNYHSSAFLPNAQVNQPESSTSLHMVFDFFKKRAEEGVEQFSNLAKSAKEGRLSEGLVDAASYTKQTNEAFASGLAKSRTKLLYDLDNLLNNQGVDFLDDLEDILIQADVGIQTTDDVMEEVRSLRYDSKVFFTQKDLKSILRGKLLEALQTTYDADGNVNTDSADRSVNFSTDEKQPTVLFIMGANGMGKTTTIGKLANRLTTEGNQKVMLAACDTFRAGAVDQLEMWAERSNTTCYSPLVEGDSGDRSKATSPSAVLYGALDKTIKEEYDTLIVDTSGRLSNNDALTKELVKMKKVIQNKFSKETNPETEKPIPNLDVPHETLLVIDAAQGRMALDSARQWHKEVGLTGLILTKLDGSARGGSVVAVSRELGIPVKLVGVGEGIDDLRDFDPETFVDSLLGIGKAGGSKSKDAKNEGKALADRLVEMRKDRDQRAKTMKLSTPSAPKEPSMPLDMSATNASPSPGVLNRPGSKKKKNKKKKKR